MFHRVISQSGLAIDIESSGKARQNAWKYASFVGCNSEKVTTSEALLKCLKELPAEELIKHQSKLYVRSYLLGITYLVPTS